MTIASGSTCCAWAIDRLNQNVSGCVPALPSKQNRSQAKLWRATTGPIQCDTFNALCSGAHISLFNTVQPFPELRDAYSATLKAPKSIFPSTNDGSSGEPALPPNDMSELNSEEIPWAPPFFL